MKPWTTEYFLQIPGGRIAELFGGKLVYGVGVLLTAFFTILSPIAAYTDFKFFIAVRALEGLGEGVTYPAMHAMLARWIPPMERSKFAAYVYAGEFVTYNILRYKIPTNTINVSVYLISFHTSTSKPIKLKLLYCDLENKSKCGQEIVKW